MYSFCGGFFTGIISATILAIYIVATTNQNQTKYSALYACPPESKSQSLRHLKRNNSGDLIACVYQPTGKWIKMGGK